MKISVVIPCKPPESNLETLCLKLISTPVSEILIVTSAPLNLAIISPKIRIIDAPSGRANKLNLGAQQAQGDYIWFLHADTELKENSYQSLKASLQRNPEALHYFNLRFHDGPPTMAINTLGVWIRSRLLRLPFGDQAFCLSKKLFEQLGGFDTKADYGEDHLLVWKAHQNSVPLRCTNGWVCTSGRKYQVHGWKKTTKEHLTKTFNQGYREFLKLIRGESQ